MMTYSRIRKTFGESKRNSGLAIVSVLISVTVFCLTILYLVQTNSLVDYSYRIREQKNRLQSLEGDKQKMEAEIAKWRSPANLEEIAERLEMVEIGQVVYLKTEQKKVVAVDPAGLVNRND